MVPNKLHTQAREQFYVCDSQDVAGNTIWNSNDKILTKLTTNYCTTMAERISRHVNTHCAPDEGERCQEIQRVSRGPARAAVGPLASPRRQTSRALAPSSRCRLAAPGRTRTSGCPGTAEHTKESTCSDKTKYQVSYTWAADTSPEIYFRGCFLPSLPSLSFISFSSPFFPFPSLPCLEVAPQIQLRDLGERC